MHILFARDVGADEHSAPSGRLDPFAGLTTGILVGVGYRNGISLPGKAERDSAADALSAARNR
jgi:hypothetical protein